ncbi:hypothetical protein CXG81DRAFT_8781, partial [Caulochytrium protostelioides]
MAAAECKAECKPGKPGKRPLAQRIDEAAARVVAAGGAHATTYHTLRPDDADDAALIAYLQQSLLAWYDGQADAHAMPWRQPWDAALGPAARNQRAYEVWVAETMLQQTQVATVRDYYTRWMARWPTLRDLAQADLEAVLQAWARLGYASRGKRLLEAAQKVDREMDGVLPRDPATLQRALPGVGAYTAGAIASIAFNAPAPLVDGNVIRVLSRVRAVAADPRTTAATRLWWALAEALLPAARPGDWNQAVMDLGRTVCTPRQPRCGACPIRDGCRA